MGTFEDFRQELREALMHLHDPDYKPSALMCAVMGCDLGNGAAPVQYTIIQAIKDLEPPSGVPAGASTRKSFDILHMRFALGLSQEETAERLHMSVRSVGRAQREATHMLGRLLWEHFLAREMSAQAVSRQEEAQPQESITSQIGEVDWRSQLRQELASLQVGAPGIIANVAETINGVVQLESVLTAMHAVSLKVGHLQPNLIVAVHPSALRQILIVAIAQMARCTSPGQITIHAALEDDHVNITLTGYARGATLPDGNLVQEILALHGGSAKVSVEDDHISFGIKLPAAVEITIFVVDDNPDMVHFYRRCAAGTRYRIVDAGPGQRTIQAIEAARPDIIVLDLMLPDVDGWELLAQLHKHPVARSIPVIICSIIREEDLALALGATLYLPKPVQPRDFIQALDQVFHQASAGAPRIQANSAAAC